ncbi:hypothetical protein NDU88_006419 [Pleurodeles waltl]|uniref:Uncharacterized protein n=1 Tax=Pleurodeles waltl TaxID=8319 RepID=A0AAV7QNI0_PLEWA|nr:hypothetical protein NDU88_006419 [Pleurodeles waltl]
MFHTIKDLVRSASPSPCTSCLFAASPFITGGSSSSAFLEGVLAKRSLREPSILACLWDATPTAPCSGANFAGDMIQLPKAQLLRFLHTSAEARPCRAGGSPRNKSSPVVARPPPGIRGSPDPSHAATIRAAPRGPKAAPPAHVLLVVYGLRDCVVPAHHRSPAWARSPYLSSLLGPPGAVASVPHPLHPGRPSVMPGPHLCLRGNLWGWGWGGLAACHPKRSGGPHQVWPHIRSPAGPSARHLQRLRSVPPLAAPSSEGNPPVQGVESTRVVRHRRPSITGTRTPPLPEPAGAAAAAHDALLVGHSLQPRRGFVPSRDQTSGGPHRTGGTTQTHLG